MSDVKIKFLRDYTVQDEDGKTYQKGKTFVMPETSAMHFVKRGVAEIVANKK